MASASVYLTTEMVFRHRHGRSATRRLSQPGMLRSGVRQSAASQGDCEEKHSLCRWKVSEWDESVSGTVSDHLSGISGRDAMSER